MTDKTNTGSDAVDLDKLPRYTVGVERCTMDRDDYEGDYFKRTDVLALIAQARAAAPAAQHGLNADEMARLRRMMRAVQVDDSRWDDEQCRDAMCTVFGMVAGTLERAAAQQAGVEAVPVIAAPTAIAEHRAVIEEAAQVLESAAAHNRAKGRTVLERTQQDRADRLRAILAAPVAPQAAPLTDAPDGIRGPLTDAQCDECRCLYSNLKHLQSGGYYVADDVIRKAAVYGYMNGRHDFGSEAGSAASAPILMRQAVASVVSRVGDDLRVGWLRPERCDVGTLLYCADDHPAMVATKEKK